VTHDDVLPYVRTRLPDIHPVGDPVRLPDGNLNHVWRVKGETRSVIVKHAPPHIANDPETPLDADRILIEARCLTAFAPGGILSDLANSAIRPPRPLDVNPQGHVLIMEDVGDHPTLDRWARTHDSSDSEVSSVGRILGTFLGSLHAETVDRPPLSTSFDNRPMQETRLAVQYEAASAMLRRGGVDDADTLGERARTLGRRLLAPGRCLIMGDLWPRSVLIPGADLRIIDWELAHYGRPLQDVAHFLSHLWMQAHRAEPGRANDIGQLRQAFLEGYTGALGETRTDLWTADEKRDAAIHFGAEILVRAVGPFQGGYVYDGFSLDAQPVQEAVTVAARHLRTPEVAELLTGTENPLAKP